MSIVNYYTDFCQGSLRFRYHQSIHVVQRLLTFLLIFLVSVRYSIYTHINLCLTLNFWASWYPKIPFTHSGITTWNMFRFPNEGLDGSVSMATCYEVDGTAIDPRWGQGIFPSSKPHQICRQFPYFPLTLMGPKRPRRDVNHRPPSSTEVSAE